MTARMIRYDERYEDQINELVAKSNGEIEIIKDPNLEYDPYFYERKAHLDKVIETVDNGTMKMLDQDEWDLEMKKLDEELDNLYAD